MQEPNISTGLLSTKLHEMIVAELDYRDAEINRFIEVKALNIILINLPLQQRLKLYELLGVWNFDSARKLVLQYIPDFYLRITAGVKDTFERIL